MGTALYLLAQCTWGLLQTAAGAAVLLRYRRCPRFRCHGAVVTSWPRADSLSLGMFIFLTDKPPRDRRGLVPHGEISRRMLVHEYGHTVQSLILGPLYLPVVGLPSLLWAQLPPLPADLAGRCVLFQLLHRENRQFSGGTGGKGALYEGYSNIRTPAHSQG